MAPVSPESTTQPNLKIDLNRRPTRSTTPTPVPKPASEPEPRVELRARHARQAEKHVEPEYPGQRLLRELHDVLRLELLASPIVVPLWWGLWKLCDTLWQLK